MAIGTVGGERPEHKFCLWAEKNPRILACYVQENPMGRIEKYEVTLRLPNNQAVSFYTAKLDEAKLRITKKIDDWYNEAINKNKEIK